MILRTEAVVLRGFDYGETSRIASLFTREAGRLSVIAKGARLPRSRFGSTMQPLSHVEVLVYHKATRTLHTLSESTHLTRFGRVGAELDRLATGLRIVELVQALTQEEQASPALFELLVASLATLDADATTPAGVLSFFQLRMAGLMGFEPAISREEVESVPDAGGVFRLDTGAIRAADAGPVRRASRTALRALAVFARARLDDVVRMRVAPDVQREVDALTEAFLRFHVEDAYPSRGEAIIAQLRERPPEA